MCHGDLILLVVVIRAAKIRQFVSGDGNQTISLHPTEMVSVDATSSSSITSHIEPNYVNYKRDPSFNSNSTSLKLTFKPKSKGEMSGSRIIELNNLQNYVGDISKHVLICPKSSELHDNQSPIKLLGEVKRQGLYSVVAAECQGCHKVFHLGGSSKLPVNESFHYDINVRAVWGEMSTGGGVSHLNESLATMGIPGMTQTTFTSIEDQISKWWKDIMDHEMHAAAAEEKLIAVARGSYHQGVPAITVICDGGWSKRSHKHSHSATGGVAIIIGKATGKLLHVGVRNKSCYICTAAESKKEEPDAHTCYKNWKESSQAMEADIIIEGFKNADNYGLRYINFVGDGDSSVHARILQDVPIWGRFVQKVECANHATKCLRSSLEKLVVDKPHYNKMKLLGKGQRIRLVTAVRCAIKMRSESNTTNPVASLRHDIKNSIHH